MRCFFCPCFLSLQMHHPIQMKPADSEKSNGEWHCTHAQWQTHQYHTHTYTCMHASIAFFEFCLVMAISAWLADSAGDSGKRLKHRAEERKGLGWGNTDIYKLYINIFFYVWWIIKVVHKEVSESWIILASLWTGLSPLWLLTHTNMLYALSSCRTRMHARSRARACMHTSSVAHPRPQITPFPNYIPQIQLWIDFLYRASSSIPSHSKRKLLDSV